MLQPLRYQDWGIAPALVTVQDGENVRDEANGRESPIDKTNYKTDSLVATIGLRIAKGIAKIAKGIAGTAKIIAKGTVGTARIIAKETATIDCRTAKIVGMIGMTSGTTIMAIGITAAGMVRGDRALVGIIGGTTIPH
ncbi:hypothetical protein CA54_58650 [Symmachiella macrocystis]|uniref:Uncharacterized protein n=1 Tax=Symmachiella macrocystis TaxID=2527985 RepID=A0A5C6B082_9PLAN|nr:hypothetical protein CA54_58650 [Symmachiella macrocystis]